MEEDTRKALAHLTERVKELETAIKAHRALISQHHMALKTVATIMGELRNVHPSP